MFGWEFPPKSSGGLGTACYGLTKGLSSLGVHITLVLPKNQETSNFNDEHLSIVSAEDSQGTFEIRTINSILNPYMSSKSYSFHKAANSRNFSEALYGQNLFEEVERYSNAAISIAEQEDFDVIHCHDWMTFKAGMNAKEISGKPLIIHVHATEFDRTANQGVNETVYEIEKQGMQYADIVLPVSNFTKNKLIRDYGIPEEKIRVVHNSVDSCYINDTSEDFPIKKKNKIVLYLGRITIQKGPDYFLEAAKKVLELEKNVVFIMAGSGDMEPRIIEKVAELGISNHFLFAGFLKGEDVDRAYKMADLYVMPSVSEPFGITPLEAAKNKTPVIISKQSGVSEILKNCLKVDFWDIDEMANKIISVLRHSELKQELSENAFKEIKNFSWNEPARKCVEAYETASKIRSCRITR